MAGLGGEWGSHEEFLHPRDRHGRFRKKWKMAENVINAISGFLDRFSPRTFQSDGQSAQYLFNKAKPSRFGGGQGYSRLHADWDEANEHIRSGDIDESTAKFIKMMDDSAIDLPDQVILQRTMGPEAFGLTAANLGAEDGGIEDFTGRLIADRAYSAANIGTPMSHGPGKVTMTIAVPRGTKAIIPARSPNDRGIFLDRDQELRVTKVRPDGSGGWYMMAIATPRTPGETPEPINRSPRGVGLTPQEREGRVLGVQRMADKRSGAVSDQELQAENIRRGNAQALQQQPAQLPPAQGRTPEPTAAPQQPATPGGPPPRNEPIHSESVGGPSTSGKSTSEIAQTPAPEAPQAPVPEAPVPPTPEVPAPAAPDIRRAVREAGISSPSEGERRRQWNNAYLGVASGKKHPEDMLRELESDIDVNEHRLEDYRKSGSITNDPHLVDDIKSQNQLADVIAKQYGLQRRKAETPKKAARPKLGLIQGGKAEPSKPTPPAAKKAAPSAPAAPAGPRGNLRDITGERRIAEAPSFPERATPAKVLNFPGAKKAAPAGAPAAKKAAPAAPQVPAAPKATGVPQKIRPRDIKVGDTIAATNFLPGRKDNPKDPSKVVARIERGSGHNRRTVFFDENGELIASPMPNSHVWRRAEGVPSTPEAPNKAAPEAPAAPTPEPGVAPDLDKMTVPELRKLAKDELVPLTGLTRKAQIKAAIVRNRESGSGGVSTAGAEVVAGPGVLERMAAPSPSPGAPDVEKATQAREVSRNLGLLDQSIVNQGSDKAVEHHLGVLEKAGVDPGLVTQMREALKADDRNKVQDLATKIGEDLGVTRSSGPTDSIQRFDPKIHELDKSQVNDVKTGDPVRVIRPGYEMRRDDGSTLILNRAPVSAERPPVEPNAPAAQKEIKAPDRREAFAEDWLNTPVLANISEKTAAGRSINEVRDDILKGKITPDEGIRRLENDIELNKADLADVDVELRGYQTLEQRKRSLTERVKLQKAIGDQENASSFMRKHFRNAPAVTPDEVVVNLNPEASKALQAAGPDDIREAARLGGHGDLKGSTKDELLKDLIKKVAGAELAKRAAKKAAPKKLAPAPLEPKKATAPGHVDVRLLAEGLGFDESDSKMLAHVQDMLNGTGGEKVHTPAAAGRRLDELNKGAGSPSWERVVHHQVTLEGIQDHIAGKMPTGKTPDQLQQDLREAEAKDARLKAQSERWSALAERLKKTRRPSAKKVAPPAPDTKLTPEEKKTTKAAAELLDVPAEKLQAQVVAKRVAAAPPSQGAQSAVDAMKTMQTREEGQAFLKNRTKADLVEIAKASGMPHASKDTKATLANRLVEREIGGRLEGEALRSVGRGGKPEPTGPAVSGMKTLQPGDILPAAPEVHEQGPMAQILARLGKMDSTEEGHTFLAHRTKGELADIARASGLQVASKDSKATLLERIVGVNIGGRKSFEGVLKEGGAGSAGVRPQGPAPADLNDMSPAELANLESDLGIKRTSLDRGDRIAAIRARQAEQKAQASLPRSLPASGNRWNWTAIDDDNMVMHGDSASMNLAQKLQKAGREDAAQYVADMRYRISNTSGDHSPDDVEKMVADLKAMMEAEQDPGLKDAYRRALSDIDAPQKAAPKLPESTPRALSNMLEQLNQIPAARRTGHFAGTSKEVSAVDRLAQLIEKVESGNGGSVGTVDSEIRRILRSFHESVDGAFQMWRLEKLLDDPGIKTWIRSFYPKT